MLGSIRIFDKDLFEVLNGFRGIVLVFALPALLLLLVGQLGARPLSFRLLVVGHPPETDQEAQKKFDGILRVLREISKLEVMTQAEVAPDPLTTINQGRFDLLLNLEGREPELWSLYTTETDPFRLISLQQIGTSIALGIAGVIVNKERDEAPFSFTLLSSSS
jgi:hypothetical protein